MESPKKALIIGAGPAGLTAAYELLKRTDIKPVIIEMSGDIGGISKTVNYKGNRIDIGGHRFFSKSDRVMDWWLSFMPLEHETGPAFTINYRNKAREINHKNQAIGAGITRDPDNVMLVRNRLSRIYFLRRFFSYPLQLSYTTLQQLGPARTIKIVLSYLKARLLPVKPEKSLTDFIINRFGRQLYLLFFKDYTEKVWGKPCDAISAEWGAQRIKGISLSKAISHAANSIWTSRKQENNIAQKDTETSLIERFLYPKFGPGQLWEEVAQQIIEMGGEIIMHHKVSDVMTEDGRVTAIRAVDTRSGETMVIRSGYFFSTMPVQELIAGMGSGVPENVRSVAAGLEYRDFITVGVLLTKMTQPDQKQAATPSNLLPDTWIYIQEKEVKVGRLQIFNNWSPYMVKDASTVWVGMEYFCNKGDSYWERTDDDIKRLAIQELEQIGLAKVEDVLDTTVLRMEKTYPAYFGTYTRFDEIRNYVDRFENLFLIGRNGMHKYNNSDHSMLTAMVAVDNICNNITSKSNLWTINTEQEYHEEKTAANDKYPTTVKVPGKHAQQVV